MRMKGGSTVDGEEYFGAMASVLGAGGYQVQDPVGQDVVVAWRRDFRWRWMATALHTVVVVGRAGVATGSGLDVFAHSSLEWAKVVKGGARGLQVGVGVLAVVVADSADESAVEFARSTLVRGFGAFCWPVLVDLQAGRRVSHGGRPAIGAVYSGWLRRQIDTVVPVPGQ